MLSRAVVRLPVSLSSYNCIQTYVSVDSQNRVVELEHAILRGLCCTAPAESGFEAAMEALQGYAWRYYEHRVVFGALERLSTRNSLTLREQLPAAATRMGFPDVDWARYLNSPGAPADLGELVRELCELAGGNGPDRVKAQRADDHQPNSRHLTSRESESE